MKEVNILSKRIFESRKALKLTQEELAKKLSITPQSVSRWENGQSRPDIDMLPRLAAFFGTTIDSLFGYHAENLKIADYEETQKANVIYRQGRIKKIFRETLGLMPPVKPVNVLVAGCSDDTAVFFARNGYIVSAFDISDEVLSAAKDFAETVGVNVNFFRADALTYSIEKSFDVICATGMVNRIPPKEREKVFRMIQANTTIGGLNVMSAIVDKKLSKTVSGSHYLYHSAELFGYYGSSWKFELLEETFTGDNKNYCVDNMIAKKIGN